LWTATCSISESGLSPACCQPFCLSNICLLKVVQRSAPCSLTFSETLTTPCPLCCMFIFSFLFIVQFFFLLDGWGVSLSRGLCWFVSGVAVRIQCDAWCSPFSLLDVSQAGLELASGGTGALLFS
jgi:hypothetical protein